jgi:hypothetical protein
MFPVILRAFIGSNFHALYFSEHSLSAASQNIAELKKSTNKTRQE